MKIDPATLPSRDAYRLMTSLLVPRPIAWVGTRSPTGVDNLAPFSYFMGVSARPMLMAFSVARAGKGKVKDTALNVLSTRALTISVVSEDLLDPMHQSSSRFPPEVSEFAEVGLTPVPGDVVAAPRPAEAPVSLECTLHTAMDLESVHLFIAEVQHIHVRDDLLREDGTVDEEKLRPVGRLGPAGYAGLGSILTPGVKGR